MSRLARAFAQYSVAAKIGTDADVAKWEPELIEALREKLVEAQAKARAAAPTEAKP